MSQLCCRLVFLLPLLATGCCLPALGGRLPQAAADQQTCGCLACQRGKEDHCLRRPGGERGHGHGGHWPWHAAERPGTPPGEVVPVPRFHPVPTRPVFEPQFDYPPPQLAEPPFAPLPYPAEQVPLLPAKPLADEP